MTTETVSPGEAALVAAADTQTLILDLATGPIGTIVPDVEKIIAQRLFEYDFEVNQGFFDSDSLEDLLAEDAELYYGAARAIHETLRQRKVLP